jgi:hypothetical protein
MAMTPLIRAGRKASLTVAVLLFASLLSTCGFLTDDIFPRWLSYVEASVDFRAIAIAQGLGEDAYIENLELAPYVIGTDDYSKVLVYANGNSVSRLLLLDTETLEHFYTPPFVAGFNRALASVSNGFMCGTQVVDPLNPGNAPSLAHGWVDAFAARVFRVGDPLTGLNFALNTNGSSSQALFEEYPTAWGAATASITRDYDTFVNIYDSFDAAFVNGYSVLGIRQNYGNGFAASFPTSITFTAGGTVFDSATATKTGPFPVSEGYAWLTEGGPVAFYRGDRDSDRLVRYKWGTGNFTTGVQAEEIDSLIFEDSEEIKLLSFDPSGTWWYLYDRMDGRLYKLRTWWK